jgi:dihydroorotate dehydrogenase (NAD+) catalytic subunit
MQPNLKIKIGKLQLNNPVMVASGTFGYGEEFSSFINLKKLGAIVTKTITLNPRKGNPPVRTCETPAGMLNSIGLENPGIKVFIKEKLPPLIKLGVPLIVSIASEKDPDEFVILVKQLDKIREIAGIELNISCPNIKVNSHRSLVTSHSSPCLAGSPHGGAVGRQVVTSLISQDAKATYNLVKAVRRATKKTLIIKLSPNVTDISEIAQAAERAGSDAVSLINTITAMSIDIERRKPKIAMVTAGLSGPAIRPIAVRMTWEVYQKISIPIIGMGGIIDAPSALEFIIAGATAVSIGTANFINPKAAIEVIDGLKEYLNKNKIKEIKSLTGSLKI